MRAVCDATVLAAARTRKGVCANIMGSGGNEVGGVRCLRFIWGKMSWVHWGGAGELRYGRTPKALRS